MRATKSSRARFEVTYSGLPSAKKITYKTDGAGGEPCGDGIAHRVRLPLLRRPVHHFVVGE